ncbi:MAG: hypothetical protein ACE5JL_01210 [Dehalococcoidia bacterium]
MAVARPLKLTAMYHAHAAAGATFVDRDGWKLPAKYTSVDEEVEMVRKAGGVCDISSVGKLGVQGTDALGKLAEVLSLSRPLEVGWAQRCSVPTSDASNGDGITVVGLAYDEALVLTPPSEVASLAKFLEERLDGCAHLVDVTSSWAGVKIVGPLSHNVLTRLVELDLDPAVLDDGRCVQGKAAEVHALVLRSDLGGMLAYQLYVTRDFGEYIWDALLHAGRREGVGPVGFEALDRVRLAE